MPGGVRGASEDFRGFHGVPSEERSREYLGLSGGSQGHLRGSKRASWGTWESPKLFSES